eukprot:6480620-Amphidinium_carterae.1
MDHDRLIADRRPMNSLETMVAKPQLPYVAALCSCYLPPGKVWRLSSRDLKDYYFQLAVPVERWIKQQIGPRVPRSWFDDLANDKLDSRGAPSSWHWPDVHATWKSHSEPSPLADWCQPCITAVMMGDINGVTIAQEAHVNSLAKAGLLPEQLRLCKGEMQWNRANVIDVYIDDVGCLAAIDSTCRYAPGWDTQHMQEVDAHYIRSDVCQSSHKAVDSNLHGQIWGAEVDGCKGLVGAPLLRRVGVLCLGWLWICTPTERSVAESIVGTMSCSFLFQRSLFSILGRTYPFVRNMKRRKKTPLSPEVADEIFVSSCMQLAADTCVRWSLHSRVWASDASLFAGGATWTDVPPRMAERLYDFVEHCGDRPLLSEVLESGDSDLSGLKDCRQDAGRLLGRAPWKVAFYFTFKCHEHINILELRALVRLVQRIQSQGLRRVRILVGLDSKVVIGAATRGRSSSRALNHHLRRLAFFCMGYEIKLLLFWLPTWGNPADAPSRNMPLQSWSDKLPAEVVDWDVVLAELGSPLSAVTSANLVPLVPGSSSSCSSEPASRFLQPCEVLAVCGSLSRLIKTCRCLGLAAVSWDRALDPRGRHEILHWVGSGRVQVVWLRLGREQEALLDWCIDL